MTLMFQYPAPCSLAFPQCIPPVLWHPYLCLDVLWILSGPVPPVLGSTVWLVVACGFFWSLKLISLFQQGVYQTLGAIATHPLNVASISCDEIWLLFPQRWQFMVVTLYNTVSFCAEVCSSVTFFLALSIPIAISNAESTLSVFSANSCRWMFWCHMLFDLSISHSMMHQICNTELRNVAQPLMCSQFPLHASFSCEICIIPQSPSVPGYSVQLRASLALVTLLSRFLGA